MAFLHHHARRVAFDSYKKDHTLGHHVRRLSRSDSLSLFIEALEADGCVIVRDFTDRATLENADKELRPWLEKEEYEVKVGGV